MKATRLRLAAEWGFVATIGVALIHVVYRFARDRYLPQPFLYNPNDTFMDWYYTAYWANSGGAYHVWHAIYPPLSFAWARLFSTPYCYRNPDLWVRDCDSVGWAVLVALWIANGLLAWACFRRIGSVAAIPRALALTFGLPALFALERGNLITPALTFFILGWGELLQAGVPRALAQAMALNFKPYLLPTLLSAMLGRRWRALVLTIWAGLLVYVVSWGVAGGSPVEILENLGIWARLGHQYPISEFYQTTSYNVVAGILARGVPVGQWSGPGLARALTIAHAIVTGALAAQLVVQLIALTALIGACFRPKALDPGRLALLALLLAFITSSPGGYGLVFPLFLVFHDKKKSGAMMIALICAYLLSIPDDWIIVRYPDTPTPAWLSGQMVTARFGLAVGQLARPAVLLVLALSVAVDSLKEIVKASTHA